MRVCGGCSHEYDEEFKFCPECGRRFGATADDMTAKLNSGLSQMVVAARREDMLERQFRRGEGQAGVTDAARHGADVLLNHDALFWGMTDHG